MSEVVRVDLGDLGALGDGRMQSCPAGPFQVLVCRVGGQLYAIEDQCSHDETTLSDGELDGFTLTCPLHFAQFDVRDGKHTCPPAYRGVTSFAVTEVPGRAFVEVPEVKRAEPAPGGPGTMFRTR